MKGLTRDEKQKTLSSFVDDIIDEPPMTVLDRSTLEHWASCPFMACAIADGKCNNSSLLTASGQEVHDALSRATAAWIDSEGQMSPYDIRAELENELRQARPDVQPLVLAASGASTYHWAQFLHRIHPANILRFDGGEEWNRSGQLALDFENVKVRVTSEIDLLYSGPSPELLHEVDYKSGYKIHEAADVSQAFQFQLHAALVFANYPDVRGLEVTIWNTRINNRTYRVTFDRKREGEYLARVHAAAASWYQNQANPPTWPAYEKCSMCPAAAMCPVSGDDIQSVAKDPVGALRTLAAIEAKAEAWKKALVAIVDRDGRDIVADGVAFGRNKPKSERKAAASVYELGKSQE